MHHAECMNPIRKVLCAVDFSAGSNCAFETSLTLARGLGAELVILHVWESPLLTGVGAALFGPSEDAIANLSTAWNNDFERLDRLTVQARTAGIPAQSLQYAGAAASVILQRIVDGKFDLVVIGSAGQGGLKRFVLGSVADQVVRGSSVPVVVVPPGPLVARETSVSAT